MVGVGGWLVLLVALVLLVLVLGALYGTFIGELP